METVWSCDECGVETVDDRATRYQCPVCKKWMQHSIQLKQETSNE
jgi:rubrerythrin